MSGYRVVLTYSLLLHGDTAGSVVDPDPELTGSLAGCLQEHFNAPGGPQRLVYLLDHEYTRRGLDRSRLTGVDAARAALLDGAAQRADCETALALVDVHESWTAYEPEDWHRRSRCRWEDWGDHVESLDSDDANDYELDELIESELRVDSWIDSRGGRFEEVQLSVGQDEVCASTPSRDLEPYSSEYEGYMGNWGNTMDRRYHRGAVIAWPRTRAFAVRAEASPSWALGELTARSRSGDLIGARDLAATLAPFWDRVAAQVEKKGFFTQALRTARLIDEPDLATMLLGPFRIELLTTGHGKPLATLVDNYGEQWADELVATWSARRRSHHAQSRSPDSGWPPCHHSASLSGTPQMPARPRRGGLCGTPGLRSARPSWTIELPAGCNCGLCGNLRAFLQDPAGRRLEWPLAKDRRRHVHARIDTAELPVAHHTRRVGRPYTLMLTKTDALFKREAEDRLRDQHDLAWLQRQPWHAGQPLEGLRIDGPQR